MNFRLRKSIASAVVQFSTGIEVLFRKRITFWKGKGKDDSVVVLLMEKVTVFNFEILRLHLPLNDQINFPVLKNIIAFYFVMKIWRPRFDPFISS